eukprot:3876012-Amphidinium_carterae.1
MERPRVGRSPRTDFEGPFKLEANVCAVLAEQKRVSDVPLFEAASCYRNLWYLACLTFFYRGRSVEENGETPNSFFSNICHLIKARAKPNTPLYLPSVILALSVHCGD